jgi:hypothetical protein
VLPKSVPVFFSPPPKFPNRDMLTMVPRYTCARAEVFVWDGIEGRNAHVAFESSSVCFWSRLETREWRIAGCPGRRK